MITARYKDLIKSLIPNFKSLYENQTITDFFRTTGTVLAVILLTVVLFIILFAIVMIFLIITRLISEHIDKTSDYLKMSRTISLFAYLLQALQYDIIKIANCENDLYQFNKETVRFTTARLNDLIDNLDENSQVAIEFKHILDLMTSDESDKELNAIYQSYDSLKLTGLYHAINKLSLIFGNDVYATRAIYSYNRSDYQYFRYYTNSRDYHDLDNLVASTKGLKHTRINISHMNWYNDFYSLRKGICLAAFFVTYSLLLVPFMIFVY